jgi:hypothetical protein
LTEAKHSDHSNRPGILKEQETPDPAEGEMDEKNLQHYKIARSGLMRQSLRQAVALAAALSLLLAPVAWADRTPLKPGWNMFSVQQDVEVGQQVSKDAEQQLPMLKNSRIDNYVNSLAASSQPRRPARNFRINSTS